MTSAPDESFRAGNLGRHSLIYGIGILLSKVVSFLMLPIYTRLLTEADYGVISLLTMITEMTGIIGGSRIAYGIFHFYHKANTEEERRHVLATAQLLLAGTFVAAALLAFASAPWIAEFVFGSADPFAGYIRIALVAMAFEGLISVPTALLQLRNHSGLFVLVNLVRLVLQVGLNLTLLVGFDMGVTGVLWSGAVTTGVIGTFLSVRLLREVGFGFRGSAAKDFVRFGIPLVAMQVAAFVFTFGDRYFLNRAADLGTVGLFALASQFGLLVVTLGWGSFQRVWDPQRFVVARRDDRDAIYARVFIYLNVVLVSAAVGLSLFAGDVIRVIADPAFHPAAVFVPVIVAAQVFHGWSNFLNTGIYVREKTEWFTLANWLAAATALAGYALLIPRWQAWGAVISMLASMAVRAGASHLFSQWLWPVKYEWGPVVRVLAVGTIVGAAGVLLPPWPLALSVAVHAALFALFAGLTWRFVLGAEERGKIEWFVRRSLARGR